MNGGDIHLNNMSFEYSNINNINSSLVYVDSSNSYNVSDNNNNIYNLILMNNNGSVIQMTMKEGYKNDIINNNFVNCIFNNS